MDHAFDLLLGEQLIQGAAVPDVQLIKVGLGMDRGTKTGEQVVSYHHVTAGVNEFINGMGANVASSAQNKNSHVLVLPF